MVQPAAQRLVTEASLVESVQDLVAAMIVAGTNVTTSYNDSAGTLTITASGGGSSSTDPEVVRDTIAAALVAGSGITIAVNDAADTITISMASHTHTASQISDATATGRSLLTASDASAVRSVAGSAPIASVEGLVTHDGSAGGGARPSGFFRVRWVGGTSRPTNMATGDVWERDA